MIDFLSNLAAKGTITLHWTSVRDSLTRELDVVADGFATQDGNLLTITDKGREFVTSWPSVDF